MKHFSKAVCGGLLLFSVTGLAINSADITQHTTEAVSNCLNYKVVGLCFWQVCTPVGCSTQTTLKLDHYLPDVVISSFTQPTNNPWDYAATAIDPVFYEVGQTEIKASTHFDMGYGNENNNSKLDLNNKFHEVDVIGNPALSAINWHRIMLPSTATSFVPYYSSLLDTYGWRFPGLEQFYPGSFIPGIHDIGVIVLHDWGPVYPRNGYVNQPNDAKAAAIAAVRASSIATDVGAPHLYIPLSNNCGEECFSEPVKENSKDSLFQMIYPRAENECKVFGESDAGSKPWNMDIAKKSNSLFMWVLWRHYHGCVPLPGAKYLGSIDF